MITIRYADLPEGLYAQAEMRGKRTIIYLRPGLTPEQRRRSLRRAMQSARMGHGPRLPAALVAVAVAGDVIAGTLRNAVAAVRTHVLGFVLLAAGTIAAVVGFTLFVMVSVRLMLPPGGGTPALPKPHPVTTSARAHIAAGPPPSSGAEPPGMRHAQAPTTRPGRPTPSTPSAHPPPAKPDPSAAPTPQPSHVAHQPSPAPSPPPSSPEPRGSPSPSPSTLCVFGICL